MNSRVAVLLSLLVLSIHAQSFSFSTFDASNKDKFKFNLNSPNYNNPPNGALTLTLSQNNDAGSIFYLNKIVLNGSAAFSCAFSFQMDQGAGADDTGYGADGIVFIINSGTNSGGSFGYGIGYAGITNSVGVEFDTWYNPDFGDVNGNHIGIDVNGNIRSVEQTPVTTLFNDGTQQYAWVDFNGATNTLEVRHSTTQTRPATAIISRVVDLASILGSNEVYIGFSAATGGSRNRHRILGWGFSDSYNPITTVPTTPSSVCGNNQVEAGEQCDGGSCCTSTCKFASSSTVCRPAANSCDIAESCSGSTSSCPADVVSQSTSCFCGRQNLSDGQMEYYCNANGGFYQCLGGAFASQSRNMSCGAGTQCGCDFGQACSCNQQQSPCVWSGTRQQC